MFGFFATTLATSGRIIVENYPVIREFQISRENIFAIMLGLFIFALFLYERFSYFFDHHLSMIEKIKKLEKKIVSLEESEVLNKEDVKNKLYSNRYYNHYLERKLEDKFEKLEKRLKKMDKEIRKYE
jgi:hypothetical protein